MAPPDIAALSAAQQEALQTYIAVTNQDAIAAIPLLQRSEWNVQIAIARFFDGEPATDPLAEARASLPSASSRQTANLQHESLLAASSGLTSRTPPQDRVEKVDTAASSITHQQESLLFSILLTPFSVVYRVFSAVFSPLGFLVPGFLSRLLARLLAPPTMPTRRTLPPADNARRFIREFGEEYGDHSLPFTEAGFNLTLDSAKKDLKFMVVVLLSPSHDDNATWVREVLLSTQLREWLSSHKNEVILWGGNVQDSEAYQVSASLQCTKFPFAALVCQTAEAGSSGMTVIMRAVGSISASELVAKLSAAVTAQQAQLQPAEAAETRKRKMAQWKQWRAQSLPQDPPPDAQATIRVSIRMPSGDRVVRRLQADAHLEELYAFVECYDLVKEGQQREREHEPQVSEPDNYDHVYGFRLVSPMPRVVYKLSEGGSVGDNIGRMANLIVEPIDDDEEEDATGGADADK
ncbi:hypothetical protein DV736_g4434, partial [Chaetothyriales sp. CBS 134916]